MTKNFDPTDMSDPRYDPARDPSSPLYERDRAEEQPDPDPSDDSSYKVGPGRPPKQHTWQKGHPSPNPKGRPRKVPSMKPDLKKALEDALNEKVKVKKGDKEVVLTKAMDVHLAGATIKSYLTEIRNRLDKAAGIARAADACAGAGFHEKGLESRSRHRAAAL